MISQAILEKAVRIIVRDVQKTGTRNRLAVDLQRGGVKRILHAKVVAARIHGHSLQGVVYDRGLLEILQPNMLKAKPLIRAIINIHAGRPQSFPLTLGDFASTALARRPHSEPRARLAF